MVLLIIHNIAPFFIVMVLFAFFVWCDENSMALIMSGEGAATDKRSASPQYDEARKRIIQYSFIACVVALVIRWRLYVRVPVPVLGSTPHASADRLLVSEGDMGRKVHSCSPPERRFLVGHRFFDGGALLPSNSRQQKLVPFAVFYPCETKSPSDHRASMPWLPRQDLRVATGTSRRQQVPEVLFYHWADVKMRCISGADPHHFLIHGEKRQTVQPEEDSSSHSHSLCSESFPIIIFSHGDCTHCHMYSTYCIELASRGAVVIVPWFDDGSSSCFVGPKSSSPSSATTDGGGESEKVIWYSCAGIDPANPATVTLRQEQVGKRARAVTDIARALANGSMLEWLDWGFNKEQLRNLQKEINGGFGVSIQGHSHGGATTFAVLVDIFQEQQQQQQQSGGSGGGMIMISASPLPRVRNYIAFDLWSLPVEEYFKRFQRLVGEAAMTWGRGSTSSSGSSAAAEDVRFPLPRLELQTSDEWTEPDFAWKHMELKTKIEMLYQSAAASWETAMRKKSGARDDNDGSDDEATSKTKSEISSFFKFVVKRGTDHLSICDGGQLSPRYFRHKPSKRRGLWTDDTIYTCDYAVGAMKSVASYE